MRVYCDAFAGDLLIDLGRAFAPLPEGGQNEQGAIVRQLEGVDSFVRYLDFASVSAGRQYKLLFETRLIRVKPEIYAIPNVPVYYFVVRRYVRSPFGRIIADKVVINAALGTVRLESRYAARADKVFRHHETFNIRCLWPRRTTIKPRAFGLDRRYDLLGPQDVKGDARGGQPEAAAAGCKLKTHLFVKLHPRR